MIDHHARIINHRVNDAVWIGLRRPYVVVYRTCERLAGGIELKDRHDFTRLRLLDQIAVVEAPGCGNVRTETTAAITRIAARPRPSAQNPHFEHLAGGGR